MEWFKAKHQAYGYNRCRPRAANSKELDHFAELELEKLFFLNSNLNSHKSVRVH